MKRACTSLRLLALGAVALVAAGMPSCDFEDFAPSSTLTTLRVVAVTADPPYARPGEEVVLRLTYHDALGAAGGGVRPIQISWLGGCFNPPGDSYAGCYAKLGALFGHMGQGAPPPAGQLKTEMAPPELSGRPDAVSFALRIPPDVLDDAPLAASGSRYATGYVFFAACAGTLRPVPPSGAISFPLGCFDAQGAALGADSFVPGYTQIYVFADGRTNANPPVIGFTLDGAAFAEDRDSPPEVARCPIGDDERGQRGCQSREAECTSYDVGAVIGDVAEVDPESHAASGAPLREAVWVDYFVDRGTLDDAVRLVSAATGEYRPEHAASWLPPAEPGLATLWAVARDARGGSTVVRRFVLVK
ncbi:MAG: hypothetical protein HY744_03375 [Deltaproteobacteria bacterium]|nr:hypothetical protein [Deltaproteobacteria bacterium]